MEQQPAAIVKGYRPLKDLVPNHWQQDTYQTRDRLTLAYHRTGRPADGQPPLVLLHGFQAAGLMWLRVARAFEAVYDVVMPDFPGHGHSGDAGHGFSFDLLAQDTADLLDALNLAPAYVLGHSLGAEVATRLAIDHPGRVRALVLEDPALRPLPSLPAGDLPPWQQELLDNLQRLRKQSHQERLQTGLHLLPPGAPVWEEADYVSFVEAQAQFDPALYTQVAAMDSELAVVDQIGRVRYPILLLLADSRRSFSATEEALAAIQANWNQGELVRFDGAGHFIHADRFERFVEVVGAFLEHN